LGSGYGNIYKDIFEKIADRTLIMLGCKILEHQIY